MQQFLHLFLVTAVARGYAPLCALSTLLSVCHVCCHTPVVQEDCLLPGTAWHKFVKPCFPAVCAAVCQYMEKRDRVAADSPEHTANSATSFDLVSLLGLHSLLPSQEPRR